MQPLSGVAAPVYIIAIVVGAFAVAALVVWAGARALRGALVPSDIVSPESRLAVQARARQLLRALKVIAFGLAGVASVALATSMAGVEIPDWTPRQAISWVMSHGMHVLIIAGAAYLTIRAANLGIQYLQLRTAGEAEAIADSERRRRAATLSGILGSLVTVAVLFGAGLMILHEFSINVLPILTGAGIAGLAVGFGAQYVVRDVIAGFFLILEDQIRVGDLARIQGVTGLVEQINLRTIVLRDADGAVHVFPNGGVTTVANLSKEYAYALVDVIVPLGEDVGRAIAALEDVGALVQKDAALAAFVLAPMEVLGVESIGDVNLTIRARVKTPPLAQATIARELRRRVVHEFAARGIRPYARAAGSSQAQ